MLQRVSTTHTPRTDPGPARRVVPSLQLFASVGLYGTSSPSPTSCSFHGPGGPAVGGTCVSSPPASAVAEKLSIADTTVSATMVRNGGPAGCELMEISFDGSDGSWFGGRTQPGRLVCTSRPCIHWSAPWALANAGPQGELWWRQRSSGPCTAEPRSDHPSAERRSLAADRSCFSAPSIWFTRAGGAVSDARFSRAAAAAGPEAATTPATSTAMTRRSGPLARACSHMG